MDTRRLHGPDIKQLVRVLRNDPHAAVDPNTAPHEKVTQDAIKQLPRRLRSTMLSSHGRLCHAHKGLDAHLIDDLWAWISFELEVAVGRFIYPIIMTDALSKADEQLARQLEPVVEMFLPEWTLVESAPPGKKPINTGTNWAYQKNGCPACMLARIGSDEKALFALFAGMCGHLGRRRVGWKGIETIKSKRLRFVRYWMRTHANGDQAAEEAYDLGMQLKKLRPDAKVSLRQSGQQTRYAKASLDEPPVTPRQYLDDHQDSAVDLTYPYNPRDWSNPIPQAQEPPPVPVSHYDSAAPTLVDRGDEEPHRPLSSVHIVPPSPRSTYSTRPSSTFFDLDEDRLAPLPQLTGANLHSIPRPFSPSNATRPTSSIYSTPSQVTSIASYNAPEQHSHRNRERGYDPMETVEERLDKYRKLMARSPDAACADDGESSEDLRGSVGLEWRGQLLPKPSRGSMYAAFGVEGRGGEEFEVVDETPPPSPTGEGFGVVE